MQATHCKKNTLLRSKHATHFIEVPVVGSSDASVQKSAVVVKMVSALIASFAVLGRVLNIKTAYLAVVLKDFSFPRA
jgi:hypothetical protein